MNLGMNKKDIVNYITKDDESSVYYNNIMKKYPQEFENFIDKLIKIDMKQNNNISQEEFQKFALELVIQRLRQLNCFGNPTKEYVEKVFEDTLKDIF